MQTDLGIPAFVTRWTASPFAGLDLSPWHITQAAEAIIEATLATLNEDYRREGGTAAHASATIERGAVLKGPIIIGPGCFVAAGAYLRGGVYLEARCIIGPGSELKSVFMFEGSKLAHFNFVGDSILGADVNVEAGAILANYRNEAPDKSIRFCRGNRIVETGVDKFGALVGDGSRIGANAVIAPGAVLEVKTIVPRLALIDQQPMSGSHNSSTSP